MISFVFFSLAQESSDKQASPLLFVETGFKTGLVVPNYPNSPTSNLLSSFDVKVGKFHYDPDNVWAPRSNYPLVGAKFSYTHLGNREVLGNEYRLMPFIEYNTKNNLKRAISFNMAIGLSYVTEFYDAEQNPTNYYLGSSFNWAFELFLNYNLYATNNGLFRLEGGYVHSSNGHVQLPNVGLNYALVGLSYLHFLNEPSEIHFQDFVKPEKKIKREYFTQIRGGLGWHELGGAFGPVGGERRNVYDYSFAFGVLSNQTVKYYTGFSYRFYEHFYHYFNETEADLSYFPSNNPSRYASNVYFFIGAEFLYGHVGFNIEGGLNLYKPFYRTFNDMYIYNSGMKYFFKRMLNTRMGLKLYMLNANKMPKNNLFVGANINANFSQADFTDICVGYVRSIGRK